MRIIDKISPLLRLGKKGINAVFMGVIGVLFCLKAADAAPERPNILVILLDDVGYSDLGSYGSEILTPNIDDLASTGLKFSNFHVTPTCSPTRASILTGREPHRVGMGLVSRYDFGPSFPAFRGRISPYAATLAEILKANNVSTYAIGKWHLTRPKDNNPSGPFINWPLSKGFDKFYGFLAGSTDQFFPELVRDNHVVKDNPVAGYNLMSDLVNNAIEMIDNHASFTPNRPFFMYLATPGMHAPHQAPQAYLDKQRGKYKQGWTKMRLQRFKRQKELGLMPEEAQLSSGDSRISSWDKLNKTEKTAYQRLQEAYAGYLNQTDEEIGRLLEEYEKLGLLKNTVIIVLSDNGASQEGGIGGYLNHSSADNRISETAEDIVARIDEIGGPKALSNYPLGWAQVSNTPFPYFKRDAAGGGIRAPFIISGIKGQDQGKLRDQYHYASDVMPTILDIMNIKTPDTFKGKKQLPVDGISMTYAIKDAAAKDHRKTQFYRMGHNRGIYHNGWMATAIHKRKTSYSDDKWALFNVAQDKSLAFDIAEKNPEKLAEMVNLWKVEGAKVNADIMVDLENPTPELRAKIKKMRAKVNRRKEYVFYPPISHAPEFASPNFLNKDFSIIAKIERPDGNEEGALFATGNHDSGMVLYVKGGKAVFEYNYFANVKSKGKMYRLESDREIPTGNSEVSIKFKKTGRLAGIATLLINGQTVGMLNMPKTIVKRMSHEGMDIGRDAKTAVGTGYVSPFKFQGNIEKVTVRLGKAARMPKAN